MSFIKKLPYDKIKFNWNKNPITVDLLASFLTVDLEISRDHIGSDNGWTRRFNTDNNLIIHGGIVNGTNYLDGIEYGKNLQNPYNNYVNPFHLEPIMTKEGIQFFLDYYKYEIDKAIEDMEVSLRNKKDSLSAAIEELKDIKTAVLKLKKD